MEVLCLRGLGTFLLSFEEILLNSTAFTASENLEFARLLENKQINYLT
jgi:hypothetical protein